MDYHEKYTTHLNKYYTKFSGFKPVKHDESCLVRHIDENTTHNNPKK